MLVKIYPSELIITPDPWALAVKELLLKIELTEYSTLIPTIDGLTFWATAIDVSEYSVREIIWEFIFVPVDVELDVPSDVIDELALPSK